MTARARPAGLLLKVSLALVVLALLAAAVGATRAAASTSPSPGSDSVLHVGWVQEPDNLNPFIGI